MTFLGVLSSPGERARRGLEYITDRFDDRYRQVTHANRAAGVPRVYLAHIPKTAGRSLIHAFLGQNGEDAFAVYRRMARHGAHRTIAGGRVYVGWNRRHIERGYFDFGFSHHPLHRIGLPLDTFVVTCFRDPVDRVLSYYRMLKEQYDGGEPHPGNAPAMRWFEPRLSLFLERVPRADLHAQLHMFSPSFDCDEAMVRIRSVSHLIFSEDFATGVAGLGRKLDLDLPALRLFPTPPANVTADDLARLRQAMEPEYRFLQRVRAIAGDDAATHAA